MAEKMRMESVDQTAQNIEIIGKLYPNCITEMVDGSGATRKAINFDLLRQSLSHDLVEGDEAYEFTWVGKKASILEANKPIRKTLRPCIEDSIEWNNTENLYIEGDNLEVLKLLQESYLGSIKLIFIDPPYNTGNDFIYRDQFATTVDEYEDQVGAFDEDNNRLFKNTDSNGRFHSDWCSMMYSRLLVARTLLSESGAIFISIDDNELDNLKKICDEIFGAANYVNIITLNLKNTAGASGGGEDKRLKKNCEYILIYAKNYKQLSSFNGPFVYTEMSDLIQQYLDEGKSWKYTSILLNGGKREYIGSTVDGDGNEIKVYRRIGVETASVNQVAKAKGLTTKEAYKQYGYNVFRTTNAQTSIRTRIIDFRKEHGITDEVLSIEYVPRSGKNKGTVYEQFYKDADCNLFVWLRDTSEVIEGELYKKDLQGTLWDFVGETKNLIHEGDVSFPNGKKPMKLIKQIVSMVTDQEDIVMDFFSGSATTAHSVMQQNAEDGGKRKFIMIQLPEECDPKSDSYKEGFRNICEIGKERIRRSAKKIGASGSFDAGFRVFKLDDSNMNDVYYAAGDYTQDMLSMMETNVKDGRTDLDLLFGCLLEWGLPLSLPYKSEQIDGCTVHTYNDGDLIACFDESIPDSVIKTVAKRQPLRAVFRDGSFKDSPSKINVGEIFKMLAPDTRVKVI